MGAPFTLAGAAAIYVFAARIVALIKRSLLFRLPLAERQQLEFSEAGRVVLSIEGPIVTTRFAGVHFELYTATGQRIEGRRAWFRARTSGMRSARMELLKYEIPMPGRYVLAMTGLGAARRGDERHAVVFMKPHLANALVLVLGIVLASMVCVSSLVFFLMRLFETRMAD